MPRGTWTPFWSRCAAPGQVSTKAGEVHDDLVTHRVDHYEAAYRGKEGFLHAMAEWAENFEDWSMRVTEYLDAGDAVVARVLQSARGKGSGIPVEGDFWFVFEFRDKKVTKASYYVDKIQALEAVGLSE